MVPNLYIENGWKSPFPSIYKWLFRVPMPHTSIYNWARGPPWRGHTLKYPQMTWQNLHVTRAFYPQKRTAPTWGFVPWFGICPIYVCIYVCEFILIHIIYICTYSSIQYISLTCQIGPCFSQHHQQVVNLKSSPPTTGRWCIVENDKTTRPPASVSYFLASICVS